MGLRLPALPDLQGHINLSPIRDNLRAAVQKVFQEFNDRAILLADADISEPLVKSYLGTPDKAFEELDLPVTHYHELSASGMDAATQVEIPKHSHVVFLVHGNPNLAQLVAQYIHEIRRLHEKTRQGAANQVPLPPPTFWIAVYPEAGLAFHKILNMANVSTSGDTRVRDLNVPFFPFDKDVISLHRPGGLKALLVDANPSILHETSQALLAFAARYGLPHRIQAVGKNAVVVAETFKGAVHEQMDSDGSTQLQQGSLAKWVVFDRCTDLCTPLMSQLTLEGRLDELQNTAPKAGWLPGERDGDTDPHVQAIKVLLHSATPEWCDWREQHVLRLPELQAHAHALDTKRHECGAAQDRWIRGNHLRYVQRPLHHLAKDMLDTLKPGGPVADQHADEVAFLEQRVPRRNNMWGGSGIALVDTLLDLVLAHAPFEMCARRLLLEVMFRGAPTEAQFADCIGLLLDAYGHQHIHTLTNLEAAGLFVHKVPGSTGSTESSSCAMRLLLDKAEANQRNHKDTITISSIILSAQEESPSASSQSAGLSPYGRYHPVSALLVRNGMRRYMPDWAKKHLRNCSHCQGQASTPADVFGSYAVAEHGDGGVFVHERQDNEAPLGVMGARASDHQGDSTAKRTILVVMLGGCTYAEITALRSMAVHEDVNLVILTTDILSGDRFIQSFMPESVKLATADALATAAAL